MTSELSGVYKFTSQEIEKYKNKRDLKNGIITKLLGTSRMSSVKYLTLPDLDNIRNQSQNKNIENLISHRQAVLKSCFSLPALRIHKQLKINNSRYEYMHKQLKPLERTYHDPVLTNSQKNKSISPNPSYLHVIKSNSPSANLRMPRMKNKVHQGIQVLKL